MLTCPRPARSRRARRRPHGRRPRHRLRRRRHRPRHRHRPRRRQRHHRHGPPARGRRHGAHHHVPRHRLHRGARALRLRPRLHHLGLRRPIMRIRMRHRCWRRRRSSACRAVRLVPAHARRRRSESPRSRRGDRPRAEEIAEANGATEIDATASRARRGQRGRRLPGGAEPDPARDQRAHLGRASRSSCCSSSCGSSRGPAIKKGMEARTERIRADLDAAEKAKAEAERVLDEYQAQLAERASRGRPHHRGGPPAGRRAAARPGARGCRPSIAEMRAAGRGRRRGGQGAGHRRPPARSPRSPSAPPRWSSSATSTATPGAARRGATSTRSGAGRTDG